MNNAIRVAYQALSSVFGGTQSLHTNSFDEAIGLPTDKAVKIALRTQQIISDEIFVADTVDPWAGSYLIEELTAKIVTGANELINEIYLSGGAMDAIKSGVQQKKIHESAWRELKKIESGELPVIGVNKYVEDAEDSTLGLRLEKNKSDSQILKIKKIKESRNNDSVVESLSQLRIACNSDQNVMDPLIIALKLGATVGEVNGIMREEFGTWVSPSGV
jgi:methylmalonyl-CoA mutase N-terminal domain/subunit